MDTEGDETGYPWNSQLHTLMSNESTPSSETKLHTCVQCQKPKTFKRKGDFDNHLKVVHGSVECLDRINKEERLGLLQKSLEQSQQSLEQSQKIFEQSQKIFEQSQKILEQSQKIFEQSQKILEQSQNNDRSIERSPNGVQALHGVVDKCEYALEFSDEILDAVFRS
ncbi:hypothetical protein SLS58_010499 [Diplodia intermedia]|uniref:Uncharacterized protein n=1 Tax=Diplodia intermedia TaxID=856260 RepID=A0ABR3T5N6_9PEZI